jgi:mono/diheme cytochrome c family protein
VAARRDDFRVFLVPRDEAGFVTAERLAKESGELTGREILICGPPAMIESLRSQLTAHGVPGDRIHAEEFGFAKLGASEGSDAGERRGRQAPPPPRRWPAVLTSAALVLVVGVIIANQVVPRDGGDSVRPAAASDVAAGMAVYASAGCGDCHTLDAAGSSGSVGPNLDDAKPDAAGVRAVVADGAGAMPSFSDELTGRQIADVAAFVSQSAGK